MTKQFKAFLLFLPLLVITLGLVVIKVRGNSQPLYGTEAQRVQIGNTALDVLVADELEEWWHGLSGHPGLAANEGMLFLFPQKQNRQFWMKDMNFPLDIIWIDGDTVVKIDRDLPPEGETPLNKYGSDQPVNVVLEVNSGFADAFGIKVGDKIKYSL